MTTPVEIKVFNTLYEDQMNDLKTLLHSSNITVLSVNTAAAIYSSTAGHWVTVVYRFKA